MRRWRGGDLAALAAQRVFIKQIFGHAVLRRSHAAQVGHPIGKLLNGLHLFVQVVGLDEVARLKRHENVNAQKQRVVTSSDAQSPVSSTSTDSAQVTLAGGFFCPLFRVDKKLQKPA